MVTSSLKWQCNIIYSHQILYIDGWDWIVEIEYGLLGCSQFVAYKDNYVFFLKLKPIRNGKSQWIRALIHVLFQSSITPSHYFKTEFILSPQLTYLSPNLPIIDFCCSSLLPVIAPVAISPIPHLKAFINGKFASTPCDGSIGSIFVALSDYLGSNA